MNYSSLNWRYLSPLCFYAFSSSNYLEWGPTLLVISPFLTSSMLSLNYYSLSSKLFLFFVSFSDGFIRLFLTMTNMRIISKTITMRQPIVISIAFRRLSEYISTILLNICILLIIIINDLAHNSWILNVVQLINMMKFYLILTIWQFRKIVLLSSKFNESYILYHIKRFNRLMSDLFRSYEQEFITSLASINKKIQSINILTNRKKIVIQKKNNWQSMTLGKTSGSVKSWSR